MLYLEGPGLQVPLSISLPWFLTVPVESLEQGWVGAYHSEYIIAHLLATTGAKEMGAG